MGYHNPFSKPSIRRNKPDRRVCKESADEMIGGKCIQGDKIMEWPATKSEILAAGQGCR
jgi:hypothetical protein